MHIDTFMNFGTILNKIYEDNLILYYLTIMSMSIAGLWSYNQNWNLLNIKWY